MAPGLGPPSPLDRSYFWKAALIDYLQSTQAIGSCLGTRRSLESNRIPRCVEGYGAPAMDEEGITREQLGCVSLLVLYVKLAL